MPRFRGRCLCCGTVGPLSEDHVPPKQVVPERAIEYDHLFPSAGDREPLQKPRRGFKSPSFPSLCTGCNSVRLGQRFDPELGRLASQLLRWTTSAQRFGLILPSTFYALVRPQRIARAVVGHLLAAEERSDRLAPLSEGTGTAALRDYFLDEAASLPAEMQLYLWPYAHDDIVVARDFVTSRLPLTKQFVGSVLKFRPLAFWLVSDHSHGRILNLSSLPLGPEIGFDDEVEVAISLTNVPPSTWPERPGTQEMVLGNRERTFRARTAPPKRDDDRGRR